MKPTAVVGSAAAAVAVAASASLWFRAAPPLPDVCASPETAYDEHYCTALAEGSLLDPMPEDYVHVRDIARELDINIARVLGSGADGPAQALHDAGVAGYYDKYFETYVTPRGAERLREHLRGRWRQ